MTGQRIPLERLIAGWMADEGMAAAAPPALLEQILATTARVKPQPRWRALLAEPTMRGGAAQVTVGLPSRGLALAVIAGLLLAAIAAVAIGAYLLLNPKPPPESGDWPGFRGGADRSGVAIQGPAGNPVQLWALPTTGAVLEIAVVGDRVFFATDDGRLHGVSRGDGIEQWSVVAGEQQLTGPYAAEGRLYVSDASGRFRAFAQTDGSEIWTSTRSYVAPSRSIDADGTVVFGTGDGLVVGLDGATGAEQWRVQPPGATSVGAPAFADGRVYAGTDGAGFVAVDVASRTMAWSAETTGENTGSASVIDGIAYIGVRADLGAIGTLHAFDAATGSALWTADAPFLGLPTVANGVAYSASTHGQLAAIDTTSGRTLWSVNLDGDLRSPVVVGSTVYVAAGGAHRIYAVDGATGFELWQFDLDGNANCCVSVAKGAVFVGDQAGTVYAIGGDGATIVGRPFPSTRGLNAPTPFATVGPNPTPLLSIATVTWSKDIRGLGFAPISQIAVDPEGRIWAPEATSDRIAIFSPDGTLLEEWGESGKGPGQFDFTRGNGDGYGTLAFAKDGSFYVLDVGNRRVQQFDNQRRLVRSWGSWGNGPGEYADPVGIAVAPDGSVWVLDDVRSVVEHYTADGTVLGSFDPFMSTPINGGANSLAIDAHGNLYVSGARPSQVYEFDSSGALIRVIGAGAFVDQASNISVDSDGRLFVTQGPDRGDALGILAFGSDGDLVGGFGPRGDGDDQLAFPAGIALDGAGGLYVEDSLPESARLMRLTLLPSVTP